MSERLEIVEAQVRKLAAVTDAPIGVDAMAASLGGERFKPRCD